MEINDFLLPRLKKMYENMHPTAKVAEEAEKSLAREILQEFDAQFTVHQIVPSEVLWARKVLGKK
jgi:hypothetical protein